MVAFWATTFFCLFFYILLFCYIGFVLFFVSGVNNVSPGVLVFHPCNILLPSVPML